MATKSTKNAETNAAAYAGWRSDREVDPVLAANCVLYRLMINAKREPGVRFCESFPADQKQRLLDLAKHEGFYADASACPLDGGRVSVSIIWRKQ